MQTVIVKMVKVMSCHCENEGDCILTRLISGEFVS